MSDCTINLAERPDKGPRIVVAIPTLNEEAAIGDVLRALAAERAHFPQMDIVVADGGSTDRTIAIVYDAARQWPFVHLLHNEKVLQSAAVNAVARRFSDADILIRCDAHATYPAGYIAQLVASLQRAGADSVVVPMDSAGHTAFERAVAWVSDTPIGSGGSGHRGGQKSGFVDHGHHAAFRNQAFVSAGGYDESFRHNEDAELDCRLSAGGCRIYLDASIRIGYRPRSSYSSLWRQYFNYGRGRSRTVRRHPSSLRLRQFAVPFHLVASFLSIASAMLFRNVHLMAWPVLYLAALAFASAHLTLKKRDLAAMLAGPVALTMHTAWALGFFWGLVSIRERRWLADQASADTIKALLVDPSRFTVPYDAQLTAGLAQAGVDAIWAIRPPRESEHEEFSPRQQVQLFLDRMESLPRALRKPVKALAHLGGLLSIVRLARRTKPDIVHFQWMLLPLFDALAIRFLKMGRPVFVTVHDSVPFNGDRLAALQSFAYDLPLKFATRIIVHTARARDLLVNRGIDAGKIVVVPHGPLPLTGVVPTRREGADRRWTFLLFGQIKPYKGFDVLIEALGKIPADLRQQARIIVAGAPRMDLSATLHRIGELNLSAELDLRLAYQSNEELNALLVQADCFVFPYRQIDASGAYYLAQSLGKWTIASRVGVFADEIIEGANGQLVAPEDADALSAALVQAIRDRPQIAVSSRPASWEAIGQRTASLYRSFLSVGEAPVGEASVTTVMASSNE